MYKQIIKKKKKEMEDMAPEGKPLHIGKKMMMHAMESMAPEMEDEEEDDGGMEDGEDQEEGSLSKEDMSKLQGSKSMKKEVLPEAKIEIELMLNSSKKKKGK